MSAGAGDQHWVETLFPARFGLTLDDIHNDELPQTTDEELPFKPQQGDSVFRKLAHNVSPLDVAGIKNVYERVWLMKHLENEERKKQQESDQTQSVPVTRTIQVKDASTSTTDLSEHVDIHDPCIWDSNEIQVLRSVFQTAKQQNKKLRVELAETRDQLEKLRVKYDKQSSGDEASGKRLREAVKANQRLTILAGNLKGQVESSVRQNEGLKAQVSELTQTRKQLLEEIHQLRMTSDHERLERKKAELILQHQTSEAIRERRIHEENLKHLHDQDIEFLQNTIDELSDDLSKERKDHERTKRGLNHLRQHFSSLSLHEETPPEGSVRDDQLKTFTY